ncbi:MAG: hypothetical protein NUV83_02620 [Candidatus Wolfebacteria bacterium]|nr:hypothetical protein [Candidatus Wolfebacteria bacterium]
MTEEKLVKILSELKSIKPKSDYSKKSRVLLLSLANPEAAPRLATFRSVFDFLRVSAVTAFGIILLLTIFSGVSYVNKNFSPILLPGLDQKSVITEADEINNSIDVTLKEITYLDNSTAATNNQIDQVANNKKTLVTETVPTPTSTNSQYDQKINDLLEKASQ